jgi:arylsulfatase A-like enzyme
LILLLGSAHPSCAQNPHRTRAPRPNIIFIYADDLGYGDLGSYGAEDIATPHLDRMAAEGIRFTDFYSTSPVCSPSRTALLTGQYQVRHGITRVFFPNSTQGLDTTALTLAELLKSAGYATAIVGKWHLGHLPQFLPRKHGFDYWFGIPYSNDMEWEPRNDPPLPLLRNETVVDQPAYQPTLTQRYTAECINFIARHRDEPFFLYLPHTFPHKPLHVSAEFAGSSEYGLYGDVVQELDASVGELLRALDDFGIADNTLVVFSSDNGPAGPDPGYGRTGGLRGHKALTYEGGIRVPTVARWAGTIPAGQVEATPAIMLDWFPTFSRLAGATLPRRLQLDGQDITPLLLGDSLTGERTFYFYFNEDLRAIRHGDWKYKKAVRDNPYWQKLPPHDDQLFNLATDPYERANLADRYPEKLAEMKRRMAGFLERLGEPPPAKLVNFPPDKSD